jgi:hypothetical protein
MPSRVSTVLAVVVESEGVKMEIPVKNTFLNFPGRLFAPIPDRRRASSCPHVSSNKIDTLRKAEVPRVDVLAVRNGQDTDNKKDASPASTDCGSSFGSAFDSPIGQWADYDCSQSLGESIHTSSFSENFVEHGAYITGEGGHYHWNDDGSKGQTKWSRKSCLVLRGLPFTVTECDVANFLEQCGVLGNLAPGRPIRLLVNPQGRLSGFAEVNMVGNAEAEEARTAIHMRRLGTRYIEVLPPGPPKHHVAATAGVAGMASSHGGGSGTVSPSSSSRSSHDSGRSRRDRGRANGGQRSDQRTTGGYNMYGQASSWSGGWRRGM